MKILRDTLVSLAAFAVLLVSVVWLWQQATGPDEAQVVNQSEVTDLSRSEPESEPAKMPGQAAITPLRKPEPDSQDAGEQLLQPVPAGPEAFATVSESAEPEAVEPVESASADMAIEDTQPSAKPATLYRWRNEEGRIVVADTAPESKEYETLSTDYFEAGNGENGITRAQDGQFARAGETSTGIVVKGSGLDRSMVTSQPAKCRASLSRLLDLQGVIRRSTRSEPSKWCGEYEERLELLFNRNCPLDYDLLRRESGCDL